MACPRCCGSGAICGCTTCRRCWTPQPVDGEVLACYVLDPRLKASSGPRRLQYLYDALRDLRDNLDGRLLVTRGRPEKRIPELAKAIGATSVHVSADYSPFGRGGTRPYAMRSATCRWRSLDRRIWCRRAGSPRTTARRTRCSPRSTAPGAGTVGGLLPSPARSRRAGSTRPMCRAGSTSPTPVSNWTYRPARPRPEGSGRSSCRTASPTTPTTATGPTSRAPAGCRRT